MKNAARYLLIGLLLSPISCQNGEGDTAGTDPSAAPADLAKRDTDADTDGDTESDADKGTDTDEDDGGLSEEPSSRITISDPPTTDELAQLAALMRKRSREIDLRERELSAREQTLSALERATMKQAADLTALKSEVAGMMESLNRDFAPERKAFEENKKKEKAAAAQKAEAAAKAAQEEAEKRKRLVAEMAAEREARTAQLTAAVKGMRPSSGASLLASMDETDATAVLRQLGARQAASLLGNMPPAKAASLAQAMLGPKPTVDTVTGSGAPEAAATPANGEKP